MTRTADLMLAASILTGSGGDALLQEFWPSALWDRGVKGRTTRAAKLALLDVPVVFFLTGLNHELGHVTRSDEFGVAVRLRLIGTPWSARPFSLEACGARYRAS
jgi:hypothetical protein